MNALARQRNNVTSQSSYKLMPLYSVLTNAPIEDFPKSVSQFRKLPNQTVLQILQELDDPFHQPNYDTASRRGRLAMLIGIRSSDGPVLHPLANAAGAGDASDDGDDGDSGDDDDDDDDDDDGGA
ncbi:hypothetical protein F5Y10DRAFT_246027 [Nemania abortiva]|nr:hypothetical protein F5Y10DRAFT_246027 [Nemania abortiva]